MADDKDQKINVNIGGNVGGEVNVSGRDINKTEIGSVQGDYVGGDKVVQGDEVRGDKTVIQGDQVGGDKITVGDISGSTGVAIGAGASVSVTSVSAAFDEIIAKLEALSRPAPQETLSAVPQDMPQAVPQDIPQAVPPQEVPQAAPEDIEDAIAAVKEVRAEVEKGDEADEKFLARQLRNIARMGPDILDVVTATLASPIAGITAVVQKVAAKAREEAGLEPV
jgi:hypothetical protein